MLIGISGRRGSGKNTVAEIIRELDPDKCWQIKAFADTLKSIASKLTGEPLEMMYSQEGKKLLLPEWGMTIGQFLQRLGTDAIRDNLHPDAWVIATLSQYYKSIDNFVICDVRFPNEVAAIQSKGGFVIRIEGDPLKQQGDGTRDDNHPSETALDDYDGFDAIIDNTAGLGALKESVDYVLGYLEAIKQKREI